MPATDRNPPRTAVAASAALAAAALVLITGSPAHADSIRDRQWHLSYLDATKLNTITEGEGITVAVIDTGVDAGHPDLAGNVLKGKDFTGPGDGRTDDDGHGTAMASLIAGHGHGRTQADGALGLAPATKILPIRTSTHTEPPQRGQDRFVEAVRWAVDHGAKVINMSISSTSLDQREAITYALDHDVVLIAAAGNTTQHDRRVIAPARYPGVIAVSGTNRDGDFTHTSMHGKEVVLAAPAVDIVTAGAGPRGRYSIGTGTSNSAALVAATAALVRAKYPRLNAANVIQRLITTADDRGPQGRDPEYGYGIIDPTKALTADVPPVEHNPLLPLASAAATPTTASRSTPPAASSPSGPIPPMIIVIGVAIGLAIAGIGFWAAARSRRTSAPTRTPDLSTRPSASPITSPAPRSPGSARTPVRPATPEPLGDTDRRGHTDP